MKIAELAKMVHDNAVEHGWWEDEREAPEIIALIHSEWSEALEEARAGRPMVWYACGESQGHTFVCDPKDEYECRMYGRERECKYRGSKPEGIAVELIDGCIRILDYMGEAEVEIHDQDSEADSEFESLYSEDTAIIVIAGEAQQPVPNLVAFLHMFTSEALSEVSEITGINFMKLLNAMALALYWVKKQGLDPLAVLLEKHEYNKTRPYKHGKRF